VGIILSEDGPFQLRDFAIPAAIAFPNFCRKPQSPVSDDAGASGPGAPPEKFPGHASGASGGGETELLAKCVQVEAVHISQAEESAASVHLPIITSNDSPADANQEVVLS
jgi:hypothetical protein